MNKLTQKIIDELNQQYGCSFSLSAKKGLLSNLAMNSKSSLMNMILRAK